MDIFTNELELEITLLYKKPYHIIVFVVFNLQLQTFSSTL